MSLSLQIDCALTCHSLRPAATNRPDGQSLLFIVIAVKPLAQKYFCFPEVETGLYLFASRPIKRGVAQRTGAGRGMRWTGMARLTRAPEADGEVVWSRHPNGWCQVRAHARTTVARAQGSPRRACISRKPPRRESRMFPLDLYARVRIFVQLLHTRPRVQRASGFPCALRLERA